MGSLVVSFKEVCPTEWHFYLFSFRKLKKRHFYCLIGHFEIKILTQQTNNLLFLFFLQLLYTS